jgi:hypothetical protein
VVADFIPFVGSIVGLGTGLIAFVLASVISLSTAAFAWFYYRPLVSVVLVLGALALAIGLIRLKTRAARRDS